MVISNIKATLYSILFNKHVLKAVDTAKGMKKWFPSPVEISVWESTAMLKGDTANSYWEPKLCWDELGQLFFPLLNIREAPLKRCLFAQ